MRLGQTSIIYVISKIAASIVGFFATIYFTRTLGSEIYGFFAVTLSLVAWLTILKNIGFGKAIVKRMSEDEEPEAYLAAGTIIKGILTIFIGAAVLVLQEQINAYVGAPVAEFVVFLIVVTVFSGLISNALKGSHQVHIYAPLSTLKEAARSILMIALVYIGWDLAGMLLGYAIGTTVMAVIGLWIVRPNLVAPRRRHIKGLFDFAKFSWLGSMRSKTFNDVDILILAIFVSPGLTGIYAIAYSLSKFLEIFGEGIQSALFPEMSKLSTQDNLRMISTLTSDALTYTGLLLIPGVIGAAIVGDRLMSIYGPEFDSGHWILVILLIGLVIYTYTRQLLNTLNALDRPDLAFRVNGVFIFTNIIFNIFFVWQIGWFGAAIATALSASVGLLLSFYYTRRLVHFTVPFGDISRQWVAALLMGIVVFSARQIGETTIRGVDDFNAIFVVALVGLGAMVYFLILAGISVTFRTTIANNLPYDMSISNN